MSIQVKALNPVSIGRIVHYVLSSGEHRPAMIVRVWGESKLYQNGDGSLTESHPALQLQVFTDGHNDGLENVEWKTSVVYSEDARPNTWHWPERVD